MSNWVDVHYEKAGEAMGWAQENCATYATVDVRPFEPPWPYCRFYFQGPPEFTSRDRVAFALRWA